MKPPYLEVQHSRMSKSIQLLHWSWNHEFHCESFVILNTARMLNSWMVSRARGIDTSGPTSHIGLQLYVSYVTPHRYTQAGLNLFSWPC